MSEVYYIQQKGVRYDYSRRSQEQLAVDVSRAHDFLRKLVKEKDQMERRLHWQWIWIKILGAAASAAWIVLAALIVLLFENR